MFDLVEHCHGEILHGNAAVAGGVPEQLIAADAELAGARPRNYFLGWAQERPGHVGDAAVVLVGELLSHRFAARAGHRIDQQLARLHFESGGTANHEQPRRLATDAAHGADQRLRRARMEVLALAAGSEAATAARGVDDDVASLPLAVRATLAASRMSPVAG